ncbi:hypothetical protein EMIHUDRAFT_361448, partial [Emiliania huxleyi CCMP1516]|uniref:Uncharacterized protein n=2 Tax=Emiliania huxleyi TaxID=2903 RepID=A0A0D3KTD0_EMIH1
RARPGPRRLAAETSALALLVKMAAVAIAATVVQSFGAQASVRGHEPSAIQSRSQKLLARTAADSAIAAAAVELSRRLVPHMLPPCGSVDSILPRILLPPRLGTRM